MRTPLQYDAVMTAETVRCGYADGQYGQVHYRELGRGEPLLLLHWAPSNGRQYEALMPLFAGRGLRVLAVDIPGYGRSHKNAEGWSCAEMAGEIAAALGSIGVTRGFVVGGHLSAAIAAELAIAEPGRWPRIVLDGSPTLLPAEMAELMGRFAGLSPALSDSGAHRSFVWDMTERFLTEWDPSYRITAETLPVQYAYMADYLQMGFAPIRAFIDPAEARKGGLATYRALERWPLIESSVLALTAEREALRPGHARAVALLRNAREHCFPGSHPIMDPSRGAEYATVVADFLLAP
jgi:pimeloyl-ACP methyl ester carboxylesterase